MYNYNTEKIFKLHVLRTHRYDATNRVNTNEIFFVWDIEKGLGSRLRDRVARWAAGYNIVRLGHFDRRLIFSKYPSSKNILAKFLFTFSSPLYIFSAHA